MTYITHIITGIICLNIGFLVGAAFAYRPRPKIEPYPDNLLRQIRDAEER
jgi:hypothetical protein